MTLFALIRGTTVVNVVNQATAPDATREGVDLVENTGGKRCESGFTRMGFQQYVAPPPDPAIANAVGIDADLFAAIQQLKDFRALPKPRSAAQRDAFDDQIATLNIKICRRLLGRLDSVD